MATEFTIFGAFPLEVRGMIWAKSVPDRVVTITRIAENTRPENPMLPAMAYTPHLPHFKTSGIKVPVLLRVNKESRKVGLQIYHVVFKGHCKNLFYFNPSADTIFLPSHADFLEFMVYTYTCEEQKLIRYMESLVIQTGPGLGPRDKFLVRKQLRVMWKKIKDDFLGAGEGSENTIVMQNPDIVFLEGGQMKALGMVSPE
jgi:hypothetical protein